jgi:hypothetical protein
MKTVAVSQILGRVVMVVPYAGLLSLAIRTGDKAQGVPVQTGK